MRKVARHGAAALLSAAHLEVDSPLSLAGVIAAVRAGEVGALVDANELDCLIPENRPAERRRRHWVGDRT